MSQLSIFEESKWYEDLKVKKELTEYEETALLEKYVNDYMERKGFAHYKDNKWWYTQDKYKLLQYIMTHANGKKQAIAGWELSNVMFNVNNTEKLRSMINDLRNDLEVDIHIGSFQGGYYIPKQDEILESYGYIKGKAINEMITVITNIPYYAKTFIKIASLYQGYADKGVDEQLRLEIDKETNELMQELVVRNANTLKKESKK